MVYHYGLLKQGYFCLRFLPIKTSKLLFVINDAKFERAKLHWLWLTLSVCLPLNRLKHSSLFVLYQLVGHLLLVSLKLNFPVVIKIYFSSVDTVGTSIFNKTNPKFFKFKLSLLVALQKIDAQYCIIQPKSAVSRTKSCPSLKQLFDRFKVFSSFVIFRSKFLGIVLKMKNFKPFFL